MVCVEQENLTILCGDVGEQLAKLADNSVHCVVTSPPYFGLRSYLPTDHPSKQTEIGAEETPQEYVDRMVEVFRGVKRVLREDGCLWLNLGDSYCSTAPGTRNAPMSKGSKTEAHQWANFRPKTPPGLKPKDLIGIPWRVAFALQADGWYLRSACPWIKRNAMPESVKDRPATTIETVFLLTKSVRYHYDSEAVKVEAVKGAAGSQFHTGKTATHQQGRSSTKPRIDSDKRARRSSDWFMESWQGLLQSEEGDPLAFVVNTRPFKGAHFAVFPPDLVRPCIQAATSEHGTCPHCGSPWKRVVSSVRVGDRPNRVQGREGDSISDAHGQDGRAGNRCRVQSETIGWEPSCKCDQSVQLDKCIVLDPFGGSGTTGQVALELGHKAILIELNPEYIPLIETRCGVSTPKQEAA